MKGWIAYFDALLDDAEGYSKVLREIMQQTTTGWTDGHIACLELCLLRWRGDYSRIISRIDEIIDNLDDSTVSNSFAENLLYFQAQALLFLGRTDEARHLYQRLLEKKGHFYFGNYTETQTLLLGGQIALAENEIEEAEKLLKLAVDKHLNVRCTVWFPHPRLSLSRLYWKMGNPSLAFAELQKVFDDIDRYQTPGMLIQEGIDLVPVLQMALDRSFRPEILSKVLGLYAITSAPHAVDIPGKPESLTPREMQVLSLLESGASNRLVAQTLVITERTAKAHVSSILSKLGVKSRMEAVSRSREMHILLI